MLFRSHNRKQHRSVCVFIVCHFCRHCRDVRSDMCHGSTISSADFFRKLNHAHKSWPTLSIVWLLRSLTACHAESGFVTESFMHKSTPIALHNLINTNIYSFEYHCWLTRFWPECFSKKLIFRWTTNSTSILLDQVTICVYLVWIHLMEVKVSNLKLVSYGTQFLKN